MPSRPESSTKPVDDARRLLDEARRSLAIAEVAERAARFHCNVACAAWFATPAGPAENAEWRAWDEAGNAWGAAKEVLATVRTNVAACEVDLATAQRYAGGES